MVKRSYDERIELCRQMLREHNPWNEIGKKTGFGPSQINKIKKELLGIDGTAKHTQAYALFNEGKSNYEVAQELGLTEEQTTKYKRDFMKLVGFDKLEAFYNLDGHQLQKIIECSDINVKKMQMENENKELVIKISNEKSNLVHYREEVVEVGQEKVQLEQEIEQKRIKTKQLDFVLLQQQNKYVNYKKLIENALKGDVAPLLSEITSDRREYDGQELMNFAKRLGPAVVEAIRYDLQTTSRVAHSLRPLQSDVDLIMERFLRESEAITNDWLAQRDKYGPKTFSLNV